MYFLPFIVWVPIIFWVVNVWSKKSDIIKGYKLLLVVISFIITFLFTYGIYIFTGLGKVIAHLNGILNCLWLLYLIVIAPALYTIASFTLFSKARK